MRVDWTELAGVSLEPVEQHRDPRGTFDKLFEGSAERSLVASQVCSSFNQHRGTVRGIHVQRAPHEERKALWCATGEVFDVLVDTRRDAASFGNWAALHLIGSRPQLLHIPRGVAHGYQTLAEGTTVIYLINGDFVPEASRTILWNDPSIGVAWPLEAGMISDGDRAGKPWPVS